MGENLVKKGYCTINVVEMRRHAPHQIVVKKGDPCASSCAAVLFVSPNNARILFEKVCVLSMGCGRLARASKLNLIEVRWGARGHLSRASFIYTPVWLKSPGVYPPLTVTHS